MALIKWGGQDLWEPFSDFGELQGEVNRLFGRPLFPAGWLAKTSEKAWWPEVDVTEEKDRIIVRADLPGMKQEEIEVEAAEGILTVKGERKQESESKEGKVYRMERSHGSFLRSFSLPASVNADKVSASYKHGVLEIIIPKRDGTQSKKVKVDVK